MAKLASLSTEDQRKARKGGFKRKAPKKPKSKTVNSIESYIDRHNQWVKDARAAITKHNKLETLKKQIR